MAVGIHFGIFGSLCVPVPGLLVYLGIDVELVQEGLDISLILDIYKAILEVLVGVSFLLLSPSPDG